MTTTRTPVTQADRIAAVASVYGAKPEHVPAAALTWAATGANEPLLLADAIGHDKCLRRVVEFADHRERSTQALREAAERVLHALDEAAESLHTVSVCNHGSEEWPEGDWSELRAWAANRALVAREALTVLRSALAAETSGRDGGGNG